MPTSAVSPRSMPTRASSTENERNGQSSRRGTGQLWEIVTGSLLHERTSRWGAVTGQAD
jgi:hypothetical protein